MKYPLIMLKDIQAAVQEYLSAVVGHNVSGSSSNRSECLEMPVGLVVSDIRMPHIDGLALAEKLKELSPKTPVILCTAFTETSYLLKAIEVYGDFVLRHNYLKLCIFNKSNIFIFS